MIDLLEIGLQRIEDQERTVIDSSIENTLLQLVSQPEVFETIYNKLDAEPAGVMLCEQRYCSNIGQVYKIKDHDSGWDGTFCGEHAADGIFNGMMNRLKEKFLWQNEYEHLQEIFNRCNMYDRFFKEILLDPDHWDTIESNLNTCGICDRSLLPAVDPTHPNRYRNEYLTVVLENSDGVSHRVHAGCTVKCQHCETRYVGNNAWRYRGILARQRIALESVRSYVRDISSGEWCPSCVQMYRDNDEYNVEECESCDATIIGPAGMSYTSYSELRGEEVCTSCYDNGVECSECGCQMYEDDYHECQWDDDDSYEDNSGIHNYGYKPRPIFHGTGNVFMGFELEVEAEGGSRGDGVDLFQRIDSSEQHYYLKSDGSLNYGFEIVSHPHSMDEYHNLDWSWLDKLTSLGFRSWNTSSCGLHVHIGLAGFKDQNHQIRFTKFIYDNERQAKRIAGRSSGYAAFDDKGKVIPKIKYKHRDGNRYSAVNVQNEQTLEVRIFRGSLRKERVLSGIEFTHAVCEYTRNMKIVPKTKPFSWLRFAAYVAANDDLYPNLFIIMNETFERRSEIDQEQDGN